MNIVEFLNNKNLTISCAESFTGGAFANTITNIPNASKCFIGGLVSYDPKVKENVLGVKKETIDKYGCVSYECCKEMVNNCKKMFNTDIAVSFTGNAGPSASENKPVGLCYIGIIIKEECIIKELHLKGTREEIKSEAINEVIEIIKSKF